MANELNQYLDQVEFLNKLQSGNIQQFLPRKDTSFLRGGGLPQGLGIPKPCGKPPPLKKDVSFLGRNCWMFPVWSLFRNST